LRAAARTVVTRRGWSRTLELDLFAALAIGGRSDVVEQLYRHHGAGGLGYVDAMHQSTRPFPGRRGAHRGYRAFGDRPGAVGRRRLPVGDDWRARARASSRQLAPLHPDLARRSGAST
jgi:hypothetical protein